MTKLKLKIIVDSSISYLDDVISSLDRQNEVYERVSEGKIGLEYHIVREDLSNIPWVDSHLNAKYVDPVWLRKNAKAGDSYGIVYVFGFSQWQAPAIGGWSMGFYNGHHVQLIRGKDKNNTVDNIYSMFVTFHEELFHGFDEFLWYELGISLEQILNVGDFDRDVVHAKRWNYDEELKVIIPYLIQIFSPYDMQLVQDSKDRVWLEHKGKKLWILDPATRDSYKKMAGEIVKRESQGEYIGATGVFQSDEPK